MYEFINTFTMINIQRNKRNTGNIKCLQDTGTNLYYFGKNETFETDSFYK